MTFIEPVPQHKPSTSDKITEEFAALAELHGAPQPVLEITVGPRQHAVTLAPHWAGQDRHVVSRGQVGEIDGVVFHRGEPNDMRALFDDECFGTVIWDRALEYDAFFWLTVAEIKRVLMPGGILMVCTRGFGKSNKFGIKVTGAQGAPLPFLSATGAASTTTPDYWRLSGPALRKSVFDGFEVREVRTAFMVPHLFGVGVKPA